MDLTDRSIQFMAEQTLTVAALKNNVDNMRSLKQDMEERMRRMIADAKAREVELQKSPQIASERTIKQLQDEANALRVRVGQRVLFVLLRIEKAPHCTGCCETQSPRMSGVNSADLAQWNERFQKYDGICWLNM